MLKAIRHFFNTNGPLIDGMTHIIDVGRAFERPRLPEGDGLERDAQALAEDWAAIAGDMQRAMDKLKRAHGL